MGPGIGVRCGTEQVRIVDPGLGVSWAAEVVSLVSFSREFGVRSLDFWSVVESEAVTRVWSRGPKL